MEYESQQRLSSLIKQLRGERSQRSFAKTLGVSYAAIRSWEEGESTPGLNSLEKIAQYTNQSLEQLLNYLKNTGEDKSQVSPFPSFFLAEELIPEVKKLSRAEKSKLAQFLIQDLAK